MNLTKEEKLLENYYLDTHGFKQGMNVKTPHGEGIFDRYEENPNLGLAGIVFYNEMPKDLISKTFYQVIKEHNDIKTGVIYPIDMLKF